MNFLWTSEKNYIIWNTNTYSMELYDWEEHDLQAWVAGAELADVQQYSASLSTCLYESGSEWWYWLPLMVALFPIRK